MTHIQFPEFFLLYSSTFWTLVASHAEAVGFSFCWSVLSKMVIQVLPDFCLHFKTVINHPYLPVRKVARPVGFTVIHIFWCTRTHVASLHYLWATVNIFLTHVTLFISIKKCSIWSKKILTSIWCSDCDPVSNKSCIEKTQKSKTLLQNRKCQLLAEISTWGHKWQLSKIVHVDFPFFWAFKFIVWYKVLIHMICSTCGTTFLMYETGDP